MIVTGTGINSPGSDVSGGSFPSSFGSNETSPKSARSEFEATSDDQLNLATTAQSDFAAVAAAANQFITPKATKPQGAPQINDNLERPSSHEEEEEEPYGESTLDAADGVWDAQSGADDDGEGLTPSEGSMDSYPWSPQEGVFPFNASMYLPPQSTLIGLAMAFIFLPFLPLVDPLGIATLPMLCLCSVLCCAVALWDVEDVVEWLVEDILLPQYQVRMPFFFCPGLACLDETACYRCDRRISGAWKLMARCCCP